MIFVGGYVVVVVSMGCLHDSEDISDLIEEASATGLSFGDSFAMGISIDLESSLSATCESSSFVRGEIGCAHCNTTSSDVNFFHLKQIEQQPLCF